jgi:hypothetical protein
LFLLRQFESQFILYFFSLTIQLGIWLLGSVEVAASFLGSSSVGYRRSLLIIQVSIPKYESLSPTKKKMKHRDSKRLIGNPLKNLQEDLVSGTQSDNIVNASLVEKLWLEVVDHHLIEEGRAELLEEFYLLVSLGLLVFDAGAL